MPPSVRAPIEAALAKGMIVLTQDQEPTHQPDKPRRASAWSPNDGNPSRRRLGFLEAVSSGQRVEVPTP